MDELRDNLAAAYSTYKGDGSQFFGVSVQAAKAAVAERTGNPVAAAHGDTGRKKGQKKPMDELQRRLAEMSNTQLLTSLKVLGGDQLIEEVEPVQLSPAQSRVAADRLNAGGASISPPQRRSSSVVDPAVLQGERGQKLTLNWRPRAF